MKTPRFALWILIPFILGTLCAPRRGTGLGKLLHQTGPPSQPEIRAVADSAPARDSRISRVLSALLEPSPLKQRHELFSAIGDLTSTDLAEMMARADKLPRQYRAGLLVVIMDRWLELDPDAGSKWVHAHPEESACWMAWARHFPKEALAEIHADPLSPSAKSRLKETLIQTVGSGAGTQTAALARLPADRVRDAVLSERFRVWCEDDPAAAFAFAQSTGAVPPDLRWRAIDQWAQRDPLSAAKAVSAILPGSTNPPAALPAVATVAGALAAKGIDAAIAWAGELPAEFQETSLRAVARVWATSEPIAALNWCLENGVDAAANAGFWASSSSVVFQALRSEPAQTLDWIQSLPADSARDALMEVALKAYPAPFRSGVAAPGMEVKIGYLSLLPADSQERVAYEFGQQSGRKDNLEDARFLTGHLPKGPVRAAAIEGAVKRWSGMNDSPEDEAKILLSFPDPADRDTVLSGIAQAKAKDDPETAASDLLTIRDPDIRRAAFDSVLSGWLRMRPEEARAWLTQTPGIPPEWAAAAIKENRGN